MNGNHTFITSSSHPIKLTISWSDIILKQMVTVKKEQKEEEDVKLIPKSFE